MDDIFGCRTPILTTFDERIFPQPQDWPEYASCVGLIRDPRSDEELSIDVSPELREIMSTPKPPIVVNFGTLPVKASDARCFMDLLDRAAGESEEKVFLTYK